MADRALDPPCGSQGGAGFDRQRVGGKRKLDPGDARYAAYHRLDLGGAEYTVHVVDRNRKALRRAAAVDGDVVDLVGLEPPALLLGLFDRQSRDAMTLEATMQGAAAEFGMVSLRRPSTSSSGNSVFCRNATTMASSAGALGPIGASAVVARLRHFFTVFGFRQCRAARDRVLSCDAWSSARTRGVVRAQP